MLFEWTFCLSVVHPTWGKASLFSHITFQNWFIQMVCNDCDYNFKPRLEQNLLYLCNSQEFWQQWKWEYLFSNVTTCIAVYCLSTVQNAEAFQHKRYLGTSIKPLLRRKRNTKLREWKGNGKTLQQCTNSIARALFILNATLQAIDSWVALMLYAKSN